VQPGRGENGSQKMRLAAIMVPGGPGPGPGVLYSGEDMSMSAG
jgi:hypothetical protein